MKYQIALAADLHLGVISAERQKKELEEIFFHDLEERSYLDAIIILGDLYDKKVYLNDKTTSVAIWFYQRLFEVARKKHAKIRIIYGTKSHEADQYNLVEQVPKEDLDFRVIYHAETEELFKGLHVLYLPEEYLYNKEEYYEDLIYNPKERYQYVFGHGIIDEIMTTGSQKSVENKRLHVPKFTIGDFKRCCSGEVYFGHYHIHSELQEFVYYVGSFNRWCFGEEEPKGYMLISYDTEEQSYSHDFFENTLTDKYHTIYYGYNHKIFTSESLLLKEFEHLERLIEKQVFQKIRCMVTIPENLPNPEFYLNMFKERFKFSKQIVVEFKSGYKSANRGVNSEAVEKVYKEYGFITDKSLSIEDTTSRFIEAKQKKKIPAERIKKFMVTENVMTLL